MNLAAGPFLFVLTVIGMEGEAHGAHRWLMHGSAWILLASHHRPRTGRWGLNDLYAAIFTVPSIALLLAGRTSAGGRDARGQAGIAAYDPICFSFHDWIVHRRGVPAASCRRARPGQ